MENNPFNLMYGRTPFSVIERYEQKNAILDTFLSDNPTTLSYIITGVRGSGKTVLLRSIAKELSNMKDWIVLDINPQDEIIESASEKLFYEGNKTKLFLEWKLQINLKYISLEIKKDNPINNPEIIFEKLLDRANKNNKKVLITIDEINNTASLKRFANFFQSMIGKDYKLFLLMTGLKDNINALISSEAASFLSRTPKIDLPPLSRIEITREYERIFNIPIETAAELSRLTEGYAFAYQVLGYFFFESKDRKINKSLLAQYDQYLQDNGYNVIWRKLTEVEKQLLFALAESKNNNSNEIAKSTNMSQSNYQNYRGQLIDKGVIKSTGYGKINFALPRFRQYVILLKQFE